MYNGRFQANQPRQPQRTPRRRKRRSKKTGTLLFSLVLLLTMMIGGTLAYLTMKTEPIRNSFTPSDVSCAVSEEWANNVKSGVYVQNTGDIPAYIRVKLVAYRVNDAGQHIGGAASFDITPATGWVKNGGFYYYTQPVAPSELTGVLFEGSIELGALGGVEGGYQAVDVMAEAIQSVPIDVVETCWGVTINASTGLITG